MLSPTVVTGNVNDLHMFLHPLSPVRVQLPRRVPSQKFSSRQCLRYVVNYEPAPSDRGDKTMMQNVKFIYLIEYLKFAKLCIHRTRRGHVSTGGRKSLKVIPIVTRRRYCSRFQ